MSAAGAQEPALELTVHLGERTRLGPRLAAEALMELFEEHSVRAGVLLRGAEGFGHKHHLRADRLLTLSEDLSLVAVAVDLPERIAKVAAEVRRMDLPGLATLERARMLGETAGAERAIGELEASDREAKLTLYLGRGERPSGGRPAHEVAVAALHEAGVEGATALLGVDGVLDGVRRRARFGSRNRRVPAMVVSVGSGERLAEALPRLRTALGAVPATLERVEVLRRDGVRTAELSHVPDVDDRGRPLWRKLILHTSEQAHVDGVPAHVEAVRRLRAEGAAGATALRGIWGYHGDHMPHGDSLWHLRRRVPTAIIVIDRPSRAVMWLGVLERIAAERGLITAETVPEARASARAL